MESSEMPPPEKPAIKRHHSRSSSRPHKTHRDRSHSSHSHHVTNGKSSPATDRQRRGRSATRQGIEPNTSWRPKTDQANTMVPGTTIRKPYHGLQSGYKIPGQPRSLIMKPGRVSINRAPAEHNRKRHRDTYAEITQHGRRPLMSHTSNEEAEAAFPPLQKADINWDARNMETRFPPESAETLDTAVAHTWCYERFAYTGGVDPSYVWDLDVGQLPHLFRRERDVTHPMCPHIDCEKLWFHNSHALAQHWNRYHVVSVPTYQCPITGCISGYSTTCLSSFGTHWDENYKDVPLTDATPS